MLDVHSRAMSHDDDSRPLRTGEWFITLLVLALPVIGLIMHFVWAFGGGNIGRRNFCRATLLWLVVGLGLAVLAFVLMLVFGVSLAALAGAAHR